MKLFSVVLLSLFLFAAVSAQEPAVQPVIAEIFLAKANIDGKAGNAAENFIVSDVPIFCIVRMVAPGVVLVKMDLIAVKVPGVDPGEKVVTTSYTTKPNEDRVNFRGRPQGNWVAGTYRAEIFIANKKVRNIEFEIKPSTAEAEKPPIKRTRKPGKRTTSSDRVARQFYARAFH